MKFFFQNNVTYTRGALLALFAGLFILAACGGGGVTIAPTIIVTDPPEDSPCVTNPYGPTCTLEEKVSAIDLCRAAIAVGDDCADNTPEALVSCLTDPFSAACTTAQATEDPFEGTEITVVTEQEKRQAACLRSDTTVLCGAAVSSLCSSNPFTQTTGDTPTNLCVDITGTAYTDARDNACLEQGAAGAGTGNDCNTRANVRLLCDVNPFTRPTVNTGVELCNDTNVGTSEADSAARTRICTTADAGSFRDECNSGAYGDEDTARDTYCKTSAQPGDSNCDNSNRTATICTTSGGAAPFAPLCGTDTAGQLEACKGALNTLPATDSCARAGLSGVICGTSATDTGTNPFAPICGSSTQNSNFANFDAVQELECRTNGDEADGMPLGKCATIKDNFCDGADVDDNPYATVCGTSNSANQETFCTNHGTTGTTNIGLCTNSLATVCPSDPFRSDGTAECLSNGLYANQRAEQCSKNTQGGGDCDTRIISDAVCIPSGTYANPFAAFCGEGTDERTDTTTMTIAEVRQAVYTACLGNSDTGVCANTSSARDILRDTDCIATNPDKLFATGCDYTQFRDVEADYCDEAGTTWEDKCDDVMSVTAVETARNQACLADGTNSVGGNGDTDCANRANVILACDRDVYKKIGNDNNVALCTGTSVMHGNKDYSALMAECEKSDAGVGSFATYCDTQDASGAVKTARDNYCRDTASENDADCDGIRGNTNRITEFCAENSGTSIFSDVCGTTSITTAQTTACKGEISDLAALGANASNCNKDELSGAICGDENSMGGSNPFAEICSDDMAIRSGFDKDKAQDAYCRASATPQEGLDGGVCFTIKDTFCDGADVGDNPFATLCVNNSVAQESFCETHGTTGQNNPSLCNSSRASVCPTAPFTSTTDTDCFASGGTSYANQRAEQCSKNTQGSGDCDTRIISDAVCIPSGTYANPFATFCGEGTDERTDTTTMTIAEVRQAVYTACLGNSDTGVCANTSSARDTLRDTDCVVGQPDKLFAAGCDYTQFRDVEADYCDDETKTWEDRCDDVMSVTAVETARNQACLADGTNSVGGNGDTDCANRANVLDACDRDVYKKIGNDNNVALCTGTSVMHGNRDYSALQGECEANDASSFETYCNSQDTLGGAVDTARDNFCRSNSADVGDSRCTSRNGEICPTGSGVSVFSKLCGTDTAGQLDACKGALNGLPVSGTSCISVRLSGVICGISDTDTGTDPFAPICGVVGQNSNFANLAVVQELECRNDGTEGDGMSLGKCFTIKDKFCDGADVDDNPYATVCGTSNSANQESFCTAHGSTGPTNPGLCSTSLATVCPSDPFRSDGTAECLSNGLYANQRAEQCSKNTQGSGDCDTRIISDAVCIPSGTYANPFASFCADGTDERTDTTTMTIAEVRQAVYTSCLGNSDTGVCANTSSARDILRDTDCVVGQPDKLFAAGCDYTQFESVEVDYCDEAGTTWEDRCDDVMSVTAVETARNQACLADGTNSVGGNGDTDCANRANVIIACDRDVYKKIGNDNNVALCTGTSVMHGNMDYSALMAECERSNAGVGSFKSYCDTQDASGAVKTARDNYCRDTASENDANCDGIRGNTNRITEFCAENSGTSIFSDVCGTTSITTAQTTACKGEISDLAALGAEVSDCNHNDLSVAICGDATSAPGSNPFAEICSDDMATVSGFNYMAAQKTECLKTGISALPRQTCSSIVSTVCSSLPFQMGTDSNMLLCSDPGHITERQTQCADGSETNLCGTPEIRNEVCKKSTGVTANPFATFCNNPADYGQTASDLLATRQAVYTACLGNSDTGVCANTSSARDILRTETCIVGNPTALFGSQCNYTEFESVEVDYCENPATTWDNTACDDEVAYGNTKTTRNDACLDYGTDVSADGDASCKNRKNVRSACDRNPFTKTREGTPTDLCTGREVVNKPAGKTGRLYSAIRTQICTTPTVRSFHESCNGGAYGDEVATRNEYCTDNALVGDATCQEEGLTDKFCGTTGDEINVFATVCTDARRVTYCRLNVSESACADTITTFCRSASDTDLFSPICNTGTLAANFNDYRVAACSATDERTGVYSSCTGILNMYCPGSPACPPAVGTLPASVWVASARNANDTARLNVLDEVGLDDAYTNYVQGNATGLNFDVLIASGALVVLDKGNGVRTLTGSNNEFIDVILDTDALVLSDLDNVAIDGVRENSGVAFAFIDVLDVINEENGFTDNAVGRVDTRGRYYAGLLGGTDLGGPLTSVDGEAVWNARFAGYLSAAGEVVFDNDASLLINFANREINTRDIADIFGVANPVSMSTLGGDDDGDAGRISIDAEFTAAGVIYGRSSWTATTSSTVELVEEELQELIDPEKPELGYKTRRVSTVRRKLSEKTAHGTVTGLIGKYGAVGAFVSSGTNNGIFEYAGGFVAAPVDCSATGIPFHRLCTNNVANQRDFCRTDTDNGLCPMTIANFCNTPASPADIFDRLCSDDAGTYDFARGRQCVADGTTGGACGDEDSGYIQDYCDTAAGLTNVTHCPNKYARANPVNRDTDVVDVSDFTGKALNAEGTGLETVVDNRGANLATDDRANFIVGEESEVRLGVNRASKKTIRLNPYAGEQTDEYKSGFAVAMATNARNQHYYYVGLLSGTDVGRLLPNEDVETTFEWRAKLSLLLGTTIRAPQGFILRVELSDQTISGSTTGLLAFTINGNFTDNGLLYGRIDSHLAGAGTLTGLIGQKGAVGIFKSNPNSSHYVGGFVATASVNCTALGTPFHADCTDNNEAQAERCLDPARRPVGKGFRERCEENTGVTNLVCKISGTYANLFDPVCRHSNGRRVQFCSNRNSGLFDVPANFEADCRGNLGVTSRICAASGQHANPFDRGICPDSSPNNEARAGACRAWATNGLPIGVSVLDDCAGDMAVTALICTASGANANPFDASICTGDHETAQTDFLDNCRADNAEGSSTTTAGDANCDRYTTCAANPYGVKCDATYYEPERQIYATFIDSCRKGTAAGDVDCSVYTDCAENPYNKAQCDAAFYAPERANYANQFVEHCSGVVKMDVPVAKPVGAPDSCADELAQVTICSNSGKYANPFNADICAGYGDLATIQSEFATMCYNAQVASRTIPECSTIATCFEGSNLGLGTAMTSGGIACDNVAFNDAVALENALASCDTQVSGAILITGCLQPTVTEACNANPFSVIDNGKGIDCLSDTALNDLRERFCINDDTRYDCTDTVIRVCGTPAIGGTASIPVDPFNDLCFDGDTYANDRYNACIPIAGDISPNTVRTKANNTLQNCLDVIDYECQYSETEKFDNDFCKIGTLYDAERGRLCLYGYTDVDDKGAAIPTPAECSGNTRYEVAYCSELAPEGNAECSGRVAEICTTDNGTAPFAPLCGENLTAQTEFCTEGVTTIFDAKCGAVNHRSEVIAGTYDARKAACAVGGGTEGIATDENCVDTVAYFCGYLGNVFESVCLRKNNGAYVYEAYVVERGKACFEGTALQNTSKCGTEDLGTYIKDYCATSAGDTNIAYCPKKYAGANPVNPVDTANVATLTAKALNAEGTALLPTFIADGAADESNKLNAPNDGASNFIDGGATGLNLGLKATTNVVSPADRNLTLTDTRDGFAIAIAGASNTRKHYVGILSGTDLGAPLAVPLASEEKTATWTGKLSITANILGFAIGRVYDDDITLNINLEDKKLSLTKDSLGLVDDFYEGLVAIDINGNFTANGVIYGKVTFENDYSDTDFNNGTLTGLIGVRGAVGIFKSNRDSDTTYVGGFVAENPDYEGINCTAEGTPFHPFCDKVVKLELCGGTLDVLMAAMGGSPAACNTADVSGAICASSGADANPFAPICSDPMATAIISGYDQATTKLNFVNNCDTGLSALGGATCSSEITDCLANLFGTGCDAPQYATVRNTFCTKTAIFDEQCGVIESDVDIVDGTNMARDMVCAKYGVNAGGHSSCETRPSVRTTCGRNPFTLTTGLITNVKLCIGTDESGVNYSEARDDCERVATSFAENCNLQDEDETAVKLARDMACEKSGIAAGALTGAVNDCATRQNIIDTCTTDSPFTNKGCDTATHITPEIREAFCTNGTTDMFNPKCDSLTDTDGIIGDAREMACLNSPKGTPIDKSCRTNKRVVDACTTDPFTKIGCENVGTIVGIRDTFCTITNIFDGRCGNVNLYGYTNEARRDACLADTAGGTLSDRSCSTDALAEIACEPDPFNAATPGCANLEKNTQYRIAYCTIGLNIFSDNCNNDKYGATNAARDTAIRGCITADDTRLVEGICINAVVANPCIRTPFDMNCVTDFADYYQDARTKRTTFCAGLTHNNHNLCVGAIAANPCFNNPFNLDNGPTSCDSEFADRREVLINKCIVNAVGQTPACDDVRAGTGGTGGTGNCLADPFQDSCEAADNFYFKDHADSARAARVAFCEVEGDDIRDHAYCAGQTFNYDICVYDPYSRFCKDRFFTDRGLDTTVEAERTKKIIFCSGDDNEDHGSCAHVRDLVTAATWAHGLGSALNTQPTAGTNEFLRADSASELDKGSTGATGTKLNLTTATFDYKAIGGDARDGVEFFAGSGNYYAGILGAANLGKPLSGATRTMYWNGQISSTKSIGTTDRKIGTTSSKDFTTSDAGGDIVATDFTLTIVFNGSGGTLESFTKAFLDDSTSMYYYDIEGSFNERGFITSGTVAYAVFTDGDENSKVTDSITDATLSGIIGEDGALGVFQGADFAGGFVVDSAFKARVESADWELSFDTAPPEAPTTTPTGKNQFLQDGGRVSGLMLKTLRLNLSFGRIIINNDVSWSSGLIGDTQYHYAGLSGSAYLGAPLTPATTRGTWYGKFGVGEHTTDFAVDIAFAKINGISGGTISAFIRESAGIYYLLAGDVDRAGVITGTVNYGAFTNGVRTDAALGRDPNGVLTGLIGQDGVLGAFHSTALGADGYAGGFWAGPVGAADRDVEVAPFTTDVDYADWERSFLFLADEPDTSTPQNQFLNTKGGISTSRTTATQAGGTLPTVGTLDLTATNFDDDDLGGVNTNRVDWFSGYIGATQYHYAGVFEDARRLGTPLTATTPTTGEWHGRIGVGSMKTDFTLTITYGATGGTISAFVRDTPNVYYLLDGGFDANGLIDGTVRYGAFTNPSTAVGNTVDGVLTGLIGADGALGVFHSTALGAAGYSGGFVARPGAPAYDTDVKYSDYRRGFLTLDTPDTTSPKNQFVTDATGVKTRKTNRDGINITTNTLALDTNTLDGVALGGTPTNSLFWFDGFVDTGMRRYYAGLDTTANLGAPISGRSDTAQWRGVFGVGIAKTDFTLNITFTATGGLISAFIHELEDNHYLLAGDFDANGLITGTIKYGEFTNPSTAVGATVDGVLTGLIGAEGAIGAFYSSATTGPTGYSGGFVARDGLADFDDTTVRYETWARGFLLADAPDESKPRNQFLRAKADGTLDITDSNNSTIIDLNTATFNGLPIGGLADNRYQSFDRTIGNNQRNYVGILPNTDLGAPVMETNTTELTWYGNFRGGDNGALTHTSDFILYLTIDGAVGTLRARVNHHDTNHYVLDGTFDAGGVITGTIAYKLNSFEGATPNGILTGLIGVNGAIGVFYSDENATTDYLGGFVAKPKTLTFTDSVGYADWVGRVDPASISTAENQFLQTDNERITTGATTFASKSEEYTLNLNSTLYDGAPILGDINDGVVYFTGTIGSSGTTAYAGIFNTTDLGAPLAQTTQSIEWRGVVGFNGVTKNNKKRTNFTIKVSGAGGAISAFAKNIIGENDILIAGIFDEFGLIRGGVHYAEFLGDKVASIDPLNGTLSGIIGQEGAVGVFHSTATGANAYSGGFITSPEVRGQVNASVWRNKFTVTKLSALPLTLTTLPGIPRQNQFLDGSETDFSDFRNGLRESTDLGFFALGLGSKSGADEATYKSIPLGADNTGGIGYFYGTPVRKGRLHYAYVNHDSKIGTRIQDTKGTAEYHGQFRAIAGYNTNIDDTESYTTNTDFTLTVNFGGAEDKITALVPESGGTGRFYRLAGDYDNNGVMTGKVEYGSFTEEGTLIVGGLSGIFSGLIGQDNAVGAFISGIYVLSGDLPYAGESREEELRKLREKDVLRNGGLLNDYSEDSTIFYNSGFVGGFIAHRFAPDNDTQNVRYADWAQWFRPRTKADTITKKNQFLTTFRGLSTQGTTDPSDLTTVTLDDDGIYYDPLTIPGDAKDGFAYFTAGDYGYVGILDSTDLGAPVEEVNETAVWHGQINFKNATGDFVHEFAINIDFSTSKIDGFYANIANTDAVLNTPHLASTVDFALDGDFNEHGLITGLTNFAQYTGDSVGGAIIDPDSAQAGILTGIIGQEGAVGVFHGLSQNTYVGGFAVHPQVVDKAKVNYSDWVRGKTYLTIPIRDSEFLRTTTNKDGKSEISTALLNPRQGSVISEVIELNLNNARFGLKNTVTRQNNVVTYTTTTSSGSETTTTVSYSSNIFEDLEIGLDEKDGLAYFNSGNTGFVGILDTTNLGKPLVEVTDTKATWLGQLGFLGRGDSSFHDFALTITFTDTGGTIEGSVADVTFADSTNDFFIEGDFNSQGVINPRLNPQGVEVSRFGTTYFGSKLSPTNEGFLTGIIGQEGAVGAFRSLAGYSGGFVVHPDVTDNVVYADWVQANPAEIIREDKNGNPVLTISGFDDRPNSVGLSGAFDVPLQGHHFLTTKDGVIDVGTASTDPAKHNQIQKDDRENPQGEGSSRRFPKLPVIPNYLRFDDPEDPFTFNDLAVNSKAKGGIATFAGVFILGFGSRTHNYGGILDNTDLGPVLTESVTDAAWNGQFVFEDYFNNVPYYVKRDDFTLNVSFDGTDGEVWAFLTNIGAGTDFYQNRDLRLEGTFGFDGVISGRTILKNYTNDTYVPGDLDAVFNLPRNKGKTDSLDEGVLELLSTEIGKLTGLIGQHGAVGLFHRINWDASGGGGFAVAPPNVAPSDKVIFSDWTGDSNPHTVLDSGAVAPGGSNLAAFIELNVREEIVLSNKPPIDPHILRLEGDDKSGFGYWSGRVGNRINQHYGGLLPSTDLGAPLRDGTKNGIWTGTIAGITDGLPFATAFKLKVDFGGVITSRFGVVQYSGAGTLQSIANQTNSTYAAGANTPGNVYVITGGRTNHPNFFNFVGEFNTQGVITGKVIHQNGEEDLLIPRRGESVFSGLIGENGAVGLFGGAGAGQFHERGRNPFGFIGGFVVNPPSP